MKISHYNYEAYLLDYFEGSLDNVTRQELLSFIEANHLQDQFDDWSPTYLPTEKMTYPFKEELKKERRPLQLALYISAAAAILVVVAAAWFAIKVFQSDTSELPQEVVELEKGVEPSKQVIQSVSPLTTDGSLAENELVDRPAPIAETAPIVLDEEASERPLEMLTEGKLQPIGSTSISNNEKNMKELMANIQIDRHKIPEDKPLQSFYSNLVARLGKTLIPEMVGEDYGLNEDRDNEEIAPKPGSQLLNSILNQIENE